MIPAQRRASIFERVTERGAVAVADLCSELGISPSTARRDLEYLTEQGYLERSHGGAVVRRLSRAAFEPHREISAEMHRPAKIAIGSAAAALVCAGQSVIFDSSSTVLEAARAVVKHDVAITAITNDIAIATHLAQGASILLIVVGGTARPNSTTLLGEPGRSVLSALRADLAFLGVHGLDDNGVTETSLDLAATKRLIIGAAKRVVALADGSKFGSVSLCHVAHAEELHEVITDAHAPEPLVAQIRSHGVEVRRVDAAGSAS